MDADDGPVESGPQLPTSCSLPTTAAAAASASAAVAVRVRRPSCGFRGRVVRCGVLGAVLRVAW